MIESMSIKLPIAHGGSSMNKHATVRSVELSAFERSECAEVIFNPSLEGLALSGLADAEWACVQRCPIDTR
jgi:hypothetical protein